MSVNVKKLKKKLVIALAVVVAIVVIIVGLNIYNAVKKANALKVDIKDTVYSPGISQASVKSTDYKFIEVSFSVTNNSDQSLTINPLEQSIVMDQKGARYAATEINIDDPFKSVILKPKETHSGQLSYAVPKNIEKPKFYFEVKDIEFKYQINLSPKS